jgi:5'-3' exonuclease
VAVRGAAALAQNLREHRDDALLYRRLATLRTDVPLKEEIEALRWRGAPRAELTALCQEFSATDVLERVTRWRE